MQIKLENLTFWQLRQGRLFRIQDYQRAYSWGKEKLLVDWEVALLDELPYKIDPL